MRSRTMRRRVLPVGLAVLAVAGGAVAVLTAPPAQAAEPVVVISNTFEDGTVQSWTPRADEAVANSTAAAHAGTHSLLVTGRTRTWEGPTLNVLSTMQKGTSYTLSVWVRLAAGEAATQARLSVERRLATVANYDQVVGNTNVSNGAWTQLTGSYTLANDADFVTVYVETASGTPSLHIDDFTMSYVPATPIQTNIPSLKTVLAGDFPVGAAIGLPQTLGERARLLTKHFSQVTPGNAMKWDATEPTEGAFRYADADAIVAFAKANGLRVRGHTLVWHNQTPAWVFTDAAGQPMTATAANKTLLLARLEAHIRAVAGRYANDLYAWDVVNEVIDENQADGLRRSTWYNITGLDYIRTAFRVARQVAPNAKLYINDFNTNVPAKRDKLFALVQQLKAEGVPVDGVGHQMHSNVDWPSAADTDAMIAKFIPLGVLQEITEMDVSIYTNSGESFPTPPADRLTRQADRYKALFDVYRKYKANLASVTLWGIADDDTWLDTFPVARKDAPLLFDVSLQAKAAYWSLVGTASPSGSNTASPTASPTVSPTASPTVSPTASPTASPSSTPSSTPSATAPVGGCRVSYTVVNQWTGGFQGEVKITNTAASIVNGWTLRWSFPNGQQITQIWNAAQVTSGAAVAASNLSYNGTIAPAATVAFGFLGSWTGTNGKPTAFTLDNSACAVA
jgi:endo-1,4-beta-xylanase